MNAPLDELHADAIAARNELRRKADMCRLEVAARAHLLAMRMDRRLSH